MPAPAGWCPEVGQVWGQRSDFGGAGGRSCGLSKLLPWCEPDSIFDPYNLKKWSCLPTGLARHCDFSTSFTASFASTIECKLLFDPQTSMKLVSPASITNCFSEQTGQHPKYIYEGRRRVCLGLPEDSFTFPCWRWTSSFFWSYILNNSNLLFGWYRCRSRLGNRLCFGSIWLIVFHRSWAG